MDTDLTYPVEKEHKGLRLDAFLAKAGDISRSQAKKAIEEGLCLLNKVKVDPDTKLIPGSLVTYTPVLVENTLVAEKGDLEILYQDEYLAIINKSPNLTVHPAATQKSGTLVHLLLSYFPQMAEMEGERPGIVHRIDKDTSGIIVVALEEKTRRLLAEMFAQRQVHKTYIALVHGIVPKSGLIDQAIGRHPTQKTKMTVVDKNKGREALTTYTRLYFHKLKQFSLVKVCIHTGRTHQIRVHFAHVGHPLLGDTTYIPESKLRISQNMPKAPRQMLHAWQIAFTHPISGKNIRVACKMPMDMKDILHALHKPTQRCIITGLPGCGKSAVLQIFSKLGYPVWSADLAVKTLYEKEGAGTYLLRQRLGAQVVPENQGIDTTKLFAFMSESYENKALVESIVHPLVNSNMEDFFTEAELHNQKMAFAEVPLYFESNGFLRRNHKVITVLADKFQRQVRLEQRGWSKEQQELMEAWQLSQEEKTKKSEYIINNNENLENLIPLCQDFIKKMRLKRS